jgi:hypothetical protein
MFSELLLETVRKVPDSLPESGRDNRQKPGFSAYLHFLTRPNSRSRRSWNPFSDSFREGVSAKFTMAKNTLVTISMTKYGPFGGCAGILGAAKLPPSRTRYPTGRG